MRSDQYHHPRLLHSLSNQICQIRLTTHSMNVLIISWVVKTVIKSIWRFEHHEAIWNWFEESKFQILQIPFFKLLWAAKSLLREERGKTLVKAAYPPSEDRIRFHFQSENWEKKRRIRTVSWHAYKFHNKIPKQPKKNPSLAGESDRGLLGCVLQWLQFHFHKLMKTFWFSKYLYVQI